MDRISEYLLHAQQLKTEAEKTQGRDKELLHDLARQWELLAREYLEFLQAKLKNRDASP